MPTTVERPFTGGTAYASAIVGDYETLHVKVDVSALTNTQVDADGFLKPNVPLTLVGLAPGDSVGTAQVETATVAGAVGASGAGNVNVTVTSPLLPGGTKTIAVAVANNDTAAQVAGKIRTALAADGDINDVFTVSGTSTAVVLTALSPAANDATLNIAIADGTSSGVTAAPTSANTTAGVAGTANAQPCVTVEAVKVAANNAAALVTAPDVFVACAVNGTLNRDVMEDTLGRALNAAEIAALTGAASRFTLSLT